MVCRQNINSFDLEIKVDQRRETIQDVNEERKVSKEEGNGEDGRETRL